MRTILFTILFTLISQPNLYASGSVDRECFLKNMPRCLVHFDRSQCKRLVANACIQKPKWNRACVKKHAPRCWHAQLTRRECIVKLRPHCKK